MTAVDFLTGNWRIACVWFMILSFAAPIGCGSGGPFDYVPVSGKITYEDGSPIPVGSLKLVFVSETPPIDEKTHPRPAKALVASDGTFDVVTSYRYGDGLIPGTHKVIVSAKDDAGLSLVPLEYGNAGTTPLVVDTQDAPFHLKVKKP